jgi:DUF4097 and DUF4098 domain-containing protein YvlB
MRLNNRIRGVLFAALVVAVSVSFAAAEEWDLQGASTIKLKGVSGDVVVRPADRGGAHVELYSDVTPRDAFEPSVTLDGSTLRIDEEWHGSGSGEVRWTIYLPRNGNQELRFATASGDLDCEDVALRIDLDTASGDIRLVNVDLAPDSDLSTASGDYEIQDMTVREGTRFSTASGDIELENVEVEEGVKFSSASGDIKATSCTGHLQLSSASGDVILRKSTIIGKGKFSSASGDVELYLDELPPEGLSASSASGDVMLDAADFGGSYTLVMVRNEEHGRIRCPFEITSERTFHKNRSTYEEQRVERGSGGPEIELETASGNVVVRN